MKTEIRIFLVDDDPFSLNSYKEQLENYGFHNIKLFSSGEDCIRHLNEKPRVIFLDYSMDQMNGLDVLQKIKRYYPQVKVVIVSGRECVNTAVNSLKCGAHDYILKGEEEVKRMRHILKLVDLEDRRQVRKKALWHRILDVNPLTLFVTLLFVLQSGVLIYYYTSFIPSLISTVILLLFTGIAFMLTRQKKNSELHH